jgi:superoxide reductase
MAEKNGIYVCDICKNTISMISNGAGEMSCCGQPMTLLEEKSGAEGKEKHIPVIEIDGTKVKVKVGSIDHPMEENHYISLIQLIGGGEVIAEARLWPGLEPEADFDLEANPEGVTARALCNIHGLWTS